MSSSSTAGPSSKEEGESPDHPREQNLTAGSASAEENLRENKTTGPPSPARDRRQHARDASGSEPGGCQNRRVSDASEGGDVPVWQAEADTGEEPEPKGDPSRGRSRSADSGPENANNITPEQQSIAPVPSVVEIPDSLYDRFPDHRKALMVALLSFCSFLSPVSSTSVLAATPEVAEDYGTDGTVINVVNAVYMLMMGVSPVVWGPMSEVYGRRRVSFPHSIRSTLVKRRVQ